MPLFRIAKVVPPRGSSDKHVYSKATLKLVSPSFTHAAREQTPIGSRQAYSAEDLLVTRLPPRLFVPQVCWGVLGVEAVGGSCSVGWGASSGWCGVCGG